MKRRYIFTFFMFSFFLESKIYADSSDKKFVFLVPSYNNAQWYENNLNSIFMQNYDNYRVIYIDDCSTDNTAQLVEDYVVSLKQSDRVTLVRNTERKRALSNIYYGAYKCQDDEIVVMLDGDDWLAHENVLKLLNDIYQNQNVWLTFGNFRMDSRAYSWGKDIPKRVVIDKKLRAFQPGPGHLRTFYAKLFKKIEKEDLSKDGEFYAYTYDLAMMFPMIEMAGDRYWFVRQQWYIYNDRNPINDHKVDKSMQRALDIEIRSKTPYERIEKLFDDE